MQGSGDIQVLVCLRVVVPAETEKNELMRLKKEYSPNTIAIWKSQIFLFGCDFF